MEPQEAIISFFKNKISLQQKITFISTLIIGCIAHLFALTNVLHNYDDIRCTPGGAGAGVASGRWIIGLINGVWNKYWGVYNLTFFNGIVVLVLISASACIVVRIFEVRNIVNCILIGGVLITFPSITSMLFFTFTAPYYGLAIFLSVLAVAVYKKKYGVIVSAACIACSMGIYQAYLPLVITLFILLLLVECIRNQWKISNTIINGIKALIPIILGLIAYFGILKFFLYYYQIELDKYQGIDSMGQFELKTLPGLIKKCFRNTLFLFKEEYCSINHTGVIKLGALILMICMLVFVIYSLYYRHAGIQNVLSVILLGAFLVIGANSIEIMCPGSSIYCLMVYSMAGLICAPILLSELCAEIQNKVRGKFINIWQWVLILTGACVILNYAWQANGNYMSSYYTTKQTVSYFQALVTRIKSVDGYSDQYPVAFIGENYEDESFENSWANTPFWYGGLSPILINRYSRDWFMQNYLGYFYTPASEEIVQKLESETKDMPSYPDSGSIKVIDGTVVVKRG